MNRHRAIVLAPPRPASGSTPERVAKLLVKADQVSLSSPDERALFGDLFMMVPGTVWPAAAVTRAYDAGDAADLAWLRADPAHFRAERANVRMLACGDIGQSIAEVGALIATLAPVFGDEGFELSAPSPHRWYLRAFAGDAASDLPRLPSPARSLGGDLFELWPEDATHRRWRRIFNETQILLAQHPVNRRRLDEGNAAINGLWFWGAGRLPTAIDTAVGTMMTDDVLLLSLAQAARARVVTTASEAFAQEDGDILLDLRKASSIEHHLSVLLDGWQRRSIHEIEWRTSEGRWTLKPLHRWRFWR